MTNNAKTAATRQWFEAAINIQLTERAGKDFETLPEQIPLRFLRRTRFIVIKQAAGLSSSGRGVLCSCHVKQHMVNASQPLPTLSGIGGKERPGHSNRLDKKTSGCLVLSQKRCQPIAGLSKQFADRAVDKIYSFAGGRKIAQGGWNNRRKHRDESTSVHGNT